MARSGWLAGQWQANLAACLTVASPVVLTLPTPGIWTTSGPGSSCLWPRASPNPGLLRRVNVGWGRGSRYAMLSHHLVLPWAENHTRTARSPGFWVAAIGELGQSPTWTPAVSASITRWAASPSRSLTGSKTGSANPSPGASNKSPATSSLCDGPRPEPGDHQSLPCVIVIAAIQGVCRLRWSKWVPSAATS
jgi:hypothetical protein